MSLENVLLAHIEDYEDSPSIASQELAALGAVPTVHPLIVNRAHLASERSRILQELATLKTMASQSNKTLAVLLDLSLGESQESGWLLSTHTQGLQWLPDIRQIV